MDVSAGGSRVGGGQERRQSKERGGQGGWGECLTWTISQQREIERAVLAGDHMCVCLCGSVFA